MGEAEAYNLGLKQSRGRFLLQLDPSLELTGDIFTPLAHQLEQEGIGLTGLHGLRTENLRHFEEKEQEDENEEVEAITGSCLAFRRVLLQKTGLFDERYRFPFYMDIDFNFAARASGVRAIVTRDLPLVHHPSQTDISLSDAERSRLTRRNFYRFLDKWGDREDLLLESYDEDEDEEFEEEEE
jgi:GT2 family glycosyltransferase